MRVTLIPSPVTAHGQSGALPDQALGWWQGTHTLLLQGLHFHLLSSHQLYRGVRVMSQCLCGFSLFWSWKRWDFSEQILLSPSTAALRVQTVTMSRINPLSKGKAKQCFWCPSFSQPVTCERQPTQDSGEPQWPRSTGWCWLSLGLPMSTGHRFTARFGAPAHMCGQCRG